METPQQLRSRWRYLRDLLIEQLGHFESGALEMHSARENTSSSAVEILKQHILDFDWLIENSEERNRSGDDAADVRPPPGLT
jgi:hypothetical protein